MGRGVMLVGEEDCSGDRGETTFFKRKEKSIHKKDVKGQSHEDPAWEAIQVGGGRDCNFKEGGQILEEKEPTEESAVQTWEGKLSIGKWNC